MKKQILVTTPFRGSEFGWDSKEFNEGTHTVEASLAETAIAEGWAEEVAEVAAEKADATVPRNKSKGSAPKNKSE